MLVKRLSEAVLLGIVTLTISHNYCVRWLAAFLTVGALCALAVLLLCKVVCKVFVTADTEEDMDLVDDVGKIVWPLEDDNDV